MITCVFGIRGMGKTRLARRLIADQPRVLAFDPYGEHVALRFDDAQPLVRYLDDVAPRKRFRCAVTAWRSSDPTEDADYFCAVCWATARVAGDVLAVFEEVDIIAPPGREPRQFRRLVAQGRHAGGQGHTGVSILSTSRRPAEVSRLLTSQAEEIYSFRIQEPADLAYFRSVIGREPTDAIPDLAPGEYVAWSASHWSVCRLPDQIDKTPTIREDNARAVPPPQHDDDDRGDDGDDEHPDE
jgi:hypothetical protein